MQKRLTYFISTVVIIVLIVGLINDVRAFFRKNLSRFYTVNFSYYTITEEVRSAQVILCGRNIEAPVDGSVSYVVDDFSFVDAGTPVAFITNEKGHINVLSDIRGVFIKGFASEACESLDEALAKASKFHFASVDRLTVRKGEPVGYVMTSDDFLIKLPKKQVNKPEIKIEISDFVFLDGKKVFQDEQFSYYRVSQFVKELFTKDTIKIVKETVYGLSVPESALIRRNGKYFIYIVNGTTVKAIEVVVRGYLENRDAVIELEDKKFEDFPSLIVVLTPGFWRDGEIVGAF